MIIPDCSFWQNDPTTPQYIDFAKMRSVTPAVILRSGQNLWLDRDFKHNWQASKDAGLLRGCYWFYDSRADPKKQAQLWMSALDGDLGEMELWCDFEDRYGGAFHGWRHWYNFMVELERLVPDKQLGIYTGFYYWKENTSPPLATVAQREYFSKYPLWIANYNPVDAPMIPEPFDTWRYWQYTDNGNGEPYGVESKNIDLNHFNGSDEDFYSLYTFPQTVLKRQLIATYGTVKVLYEKR